MRRHPNKYSLLYNEKKETKYDREPTLEDLWKNLEERTKGIEKLEP